jgi:hypothetical protein
VDEQFGTIIRTLEVIFPACEDLISPLSTNELREVYKVIKQADFICPQEKYRE